MSNLGQKCVIFKSVNHIQLECLKWVKQIVYSVDNLSNLCQLC